MARGQQPLALDAQATAKADGTATFVFQNVPTDLMWTGSLNCAGAPATAVFTAIIGNATSAPLGVGTTWGAWGGQSVFGPVQALTGQTLAVTATGLLSGSVLSMSWRGLSESYTQADLIYPAANSSALTSGITQGSVDVLGKGTGLSITAGPPLSLPLSGGGTVAAQHAYSTLILVLTGFSAGTTRVVTAWANSSSAGTFFPFPTQTQSAAPEPGGAAPVVVMLLPVACAVGTLVNVDVVVNLTVNNLQWVLYGVTTLMTTQVVTPIGNPLSVAELGGTSISKTVVSGAGSGVVLAAPTAGFAYRLQRIIYSFGAGTTVAQLLGHTTSNFYGFATASAIDNMMGLIVTEGLDLGSIGGGTTTYLYYDLISVPSPS